MTMAMLEPMGDRHLTRGAGLFQAEPLALGADDALAHRGIGQVPGFRHRLGRLAAPGVRIKES
jgi:hypothetical protein